MPFTRGSRTSSDLCAARFLLKPGGKYEEAVKLFEPYDRITAGKSGGGDEMVFGHLHRTLQPATEGE